MTIATNDLYRAAWLDRAHRAARTIDDLRTEIDIALRTTPPTAVSILVPLVECDADLSDAQRLIADARAKIGGLS